MAICTGLDAEEIEDICIRYLQNVPKEDKKFPTLSETDKVNKKKQLNNLRDFIVNTKIISEDLVNLITDILA